MSQRCPFTPSERIQVRIMRSVFRGERERGWARWFSTAVQGGGLKKILLRDGATMCAEVHGPEKSGSKMVLLNGWTLGKRDWHPNFFAGSANRTVVAVDNRGVGESDCDGAPYSMDMVVEDTVELLQALGSEPVHLLGTSMGGMAALKLALDTPELVRSLTLCGVTPGGRNAVVGDKDFLVDFMRCFEGWSDQALDSDQNKRIARVFIRATHLPAQIERIGAEQVVSRYLAQKKQAEGIAGQLAALSRFDVFERLGSLRVPTLILHGKHDRVVPVENATILNEQIPMSQLKVLDTGHLWQLTDPEYIEDIESFTSSVEATGVC